MNHNTKKTIAAITGHPAPRELEWTQFISMWDDIADEVKDESGDRLSVTINGHREVFRHPHNGRVSIEDIENARHLLAKHPDLKGVGTVLVVTVDAKKAEIIEFDLDAQKVEDVEKKVTDDAPQARRLRTVEKRSGRDDVDDLKNYLDELADEVRKAAGTQQVVVMGHGAGKSDVAQAFVERVKEKHHELVPLIAGVVDVDLSAVNDRDLENKAMEVIGQG